MSNRDAELTRFSFFPKTQSTTMMNNSSSRQYWCNTCTSRDRCVSHNTLGQDWYPVNCQSCSSTSRCSTHPSIPIIASTTTPYMTSRDCSHCTPSKLCQVHSTTTTTTVTRTSGTPHVEPVVLGSERLETQPHRGMMTGLKESFYEHKVEKDERKIQADLDRIAADRRKLMEDESQMNMIRNSTNPSSALRQDSVHPAGSVLHQNITAVAAEAAVAADKQRLLHDEQMLMKDHEKLLRDQAKLATVNPDLALKHQQFNNLNQAHTNQAL
eukprot:GILJ01011291.1.p1 GENE.GILJ01011291.1~~GILJ01011291.1.p1  ORF type:complete len:269 (-),score=55.19 GILJ01011291.1:96-902(-)